MKCVLISQNMIQRLCGLDLWLMGGDVSDGLKKDIKEKKYKFRQKLSKNVCSTRIARVYGVMLLTAPDPLTCVGERQHRHCSSFDTAEDLGAEAVCQR